MSSNACKSVGIVGAGIQGVCIGLQLLKKNIPATIFDPKDPGSMASYGNACLLYTSPSPRDRQKSRMPSSA